MFRPGYLLERRWYRTLIVWWSVLNSDHLRFLYTAIDYLGRNSSVVSVTRLR